MSERTYLNTKLVRVSLFPHIVNLSFSRLETISINEHTHVLTTTSYDEAIFSITVM